MIHTVPTNHYIDGQWLSFGKKKLISHCPLDGHSLWEGIIGEEKDMAMAFKAARTSLATWASLPSKDRIAYLHAFANEVTHHKETFAELIAIETGKPLWEAATEVSAVIGKVSLSIQAYQERTGEKHHDTPDATAWIRYKPHGVVGVLGAFNFPAHLSNGHIVPALLAGNTVIYKPSELTPAVGAFIMQCWHQSGIPKGVINCVQGDKSTGQLLLSSDIQGLYFTGSYSTGKRIHQAFSDRPEVILALEMGGNNPLVVDEISDTEAAVYQTLLSSFITSGQRCSAARRLIIQKGPTGDAFLSSFIQASEQLRIGAYTERPEPFMGPVISHDQAQHHLNAQERLIALGGKPLLKMTLLKEQSGFLSPGILDMSSVNNAPDEEIFAPFVQIYRYQHFEEAIALANQTQYGLMAGLLSDNETHYHAFYHGVRAGLINWNRPTTGALSSLPFGGVGRSGNHRPSGFFATDYCAYPIASLEQPILSKPKQILPGITLNGCIHESI